LRRVVGKTITTALMLLKASYVEMNNTSTCSSESCTARKHAQIHIRFL